MTAPKHYLCYRAPGPLAIDGKLDKPEWKDAPWTDDFVDIANDTKPRYRTRAKMMWDDECLYIGAELEEPHVWATLTEHDSVIFQDNDFEVFIDPDDDGHLYAEFEINALNTTWDLLLIRSYLGGGPPVSGWEIHGIRTAVWVDGTLNDPRDKDRGWSVEIAIPWSALRDIAGRPCPPRDGDLWRLNFSRVQWHHEVAEGKYRKVPDTPEDNWVWSPQGVVDMHRPERWGILQFSHHSHGPVPEHPLAGIEERNVLVKVFEAQQGYRGVHGRWAATVEELQIDAPEVKIYRTPHYFEASLGEHWIDAQRRFRREP